MQMRCGASLRQWIRREDIDIVHSQSGMPDFLISPSRLGVPIVTTVHSTIERHFGTLKSYLDERNEFSTHEKLVLGLGPFMNFLERLYYTNKRHYISVSRWGKEELVREKDIAPNRVNVIHNGVDVNTFNPKRKFESSALFENLRLSGKPKILYLSRLATRKGINQFLKAIPKVQNRVDAQFIVAGVGQVPEHGDKIPNCTFLGHVPHNETPKLLALSDIFVLPSLSENLSISILEAMASGVAVVATAVGGTPEVIDHEKNGLLIHPNEVDEIADAIVRLVESEGLRTKIAAEGRRTVAEKFNWKTAGERTKECYDMILTQGDGIAAHEGRGGL